MNQINLCLITDNNFVLPTAVTIESILQNANPEYQYDIYVICNKNVDQLNHDKLLSCSKNRSNISIIPVIVQDDSRYQLFLKKDFPVSISATFKFALPELLPNLEKVLYIDGDLIVQSDLVEFYSTDVSSVYAGVIKDYHALTFKGDVWERLGIRLDGYFNSGVMLLNLEAMRRDNITDKLIDYRLHGINYYMDQDTLNVVFGRQVKYLDFKYNATVTNWRNKASDDLSRYYNMEYREDKYDYLREAEIIHFCSSDKPWKYYDTHMADLWYKYFLTSVFWNVDIKRQSLYSIIPQKNIQQIRIQNSIVFAKNAALCLSSSDEPLVSIIIPAYNAERFIGEAIQSVLQSTFPALELICVNDGSTDNTLSLLQQYAAQDHRVIVLNQANSFAGVARNNALKIAKGQYVTFLDSDDLLVNCALERLYSLAIEKHADVVVSGASEFENSLGTLRPMNFWLKEEFLPATDCCTSGELTPYLFNFTTGGPAGKMVSMELVKKWDLLFLDLRKSEDFYFIQRALYKSSYIGIVRESLYYRRNVSSSLEHSKAKHPLVFFDAIQKFKEAMLADNCYDMYLQTFINENVARFAYNLRSLRSDPEAYEAVLAVFRQIATQELGLGYFPACYYYNRSNYTYLMQLLSSHEEAQKKQIADVSQPKPKEAKTTLSKKTVIIPTKRKSFKELIRGGIKCIKDHGFFYTCKYGFKKVCYWILRIINSGTQCCLDHGIRYTIKYAFRKLFHKK